MKSAFDDQYKSLLNELNENFITRNSLDPSVFQFPDGSEPIMNPPVKIQIVETIKAIDSVYPLEDYFAVGKTLTSDYTPDSDIKIVIRIDGSDLDNIAKESLFRTLKLINGDLATGTTHPLNYYVIDKEYDFNNVTAAYDVANEKWIKHPQLGDVVSESIIDYAHETLDPKVWDIKKNPPEVKEGVKNLINSLLQDYLGDDYSIIDKINITGSIGTQQWKSDTDIDVHVIPKDIESNMERYEQIQSGMRQYFYDKDVRVGRHPIEVYLQLDPDQETRGDASYDLTNNKWNKLPFSLSQEFDPDVEFAYLKKDLSKIFSDMDKSLGELRRDLVDHDIIKDYLSELKPEERSWLKDKLDKKLSEIEDDIEALVQQKQKYHQLRKDAYGPEDAEEMWKDVVKSKSWAPSNVMWKMLDRYKYISLILDLQKVLREDEDEGIDSSDAEKVKDALNFKEQYNLSEKQLDPIKRAEAKRKRQQWKDPLKQHKMQMVRGDGRKSLEQVPSKSKEVPLIYAHDILEMARNADTGIWKLTKPQIIEIAKKYKFHVPTKTKPTKHLGSTSIVMWRRKNGDYYLIKHDKILAALRNQIKTPSKFEKPNIKLKKRKKFDKFKKFKRK